MPKMFYLYTSRELDVFMCHNHEDKPSIRVFADRLRRDHVIPWLDERELPPSLPWQRSLERAIESISLRRCLSISLELGRGSSRKWI